MKFISFEKDENLLFGVIENDFIYDLHTINSNIAESMLEFMQGGNEQLDLAQKAIKENEPSININDVKLLSPLTNPTSVRDAYAFRQHVATARRNSPRIMRFPDDFQLISVGHTSSPIGIH